MLDAIMKVTFFPKEGELYRDWPGYRADTIFRPAFQLGGLLFSGEIHGDEQALYRWNRAYTVRVLFRTINCPEAWDQVKDSLRAGATHPIQMASKVIGRAEMISFTFSP